MGTRLMAMRLVALCALLMMAGAHAADDANETVSPEAAVLERDSAIEAAGQQTQNLGPESEAMKSSANMVKSMQHRNAMLQKHVLNKPGADPLGGGLRAFSSSNKVISGARNEAKAKKVAAMLNLGKDDTSDAAQNDCEYSGNVQRPCAAKPCGDHGFLIDFKCYCKDGWVGANCTIQNCKDNCNSAGMCQNGTCVCDENVTGTFCSHCKAGFNASSFPLCLPDVTTCPGQCSGHGQCELRGECICDKNWGSHPGEPKDCSIGSRPNMCSGN